MIFLILFGVGMCLFGCLMIAKPLTFAKGITAFSEKPWFHAFEIVSRLTLGILLLVFAEQTSYPLTVKVIGAVLCFVSVFLLVIGSNNHKKFAALTTKIGPYFRPLGFVAVLGGMVLIYLGLN